MVPALPPRRRPALRRNARAPRNLIGASYQGTASAVPQITEKLSGLYILGDVFLYHSSIRKAAMPPLDSAPLRLHPQAPGPRESRAHRLRLLLSPEAATDPAPAPSSRPFRRTKKSRFQPIAVANGPSPLPAVH